MVRRENPRPHWEMAHEYPHWVINKNRLFLENSDMARKSDGEDETPASNIRPMLKFKDVLKVVRLHRSTVERMIADGKFPKPRRPTGGIRFWSEAEIIAWRETYGQPRGPRTRPWNRK
jgi:predicted DNA-binding transcriptional regulator AlpA